MAIDPKQIATWRALPPSDLPPEAAAALLVEREEIVTLFRELEWCGLSADEKGTVSIECPVCAHGPLEKHAPDCRLAAFLG